MDRKSDWFRRFLLPGFAFKAVVIGGGYATGRELANFFLPSGPVGGLYGMVLATLIWSLVCAATFAFAVQTGSRDYRSFFGALLGRLWPVFEIAYFLALMVTLAVFAAAAGAIGAALFGWPTALGAIGLVTAIAAVVMFGGHAVEALFKYVSIFLYLVYAVFLLLALGAFGDRIGAVLKADWLVHGWPVHGWPTHDWAIGGLTYAAYNAIGAVVILPMLVHARGRRDAVIAGLLAGPLAMLPAILFFVAMIGFYPGIGRETLPSDFLLARLNMPAFRIAFQAMMFCALLESGAGGLHAINERVDRFMRQRRGVPLARMGRLGVSAMILVLSVFVATRIGLIGLIASGYELLAIVFLGVFLLPLSTIGLWRLFRPEPLATQKNA